MTDTAVEKKIKEELAKVAENIIVIEYGDDKELHFDVSTQEYNSFTNSMQGKNKTGALWNFLTSVVIDEHRAELKKVCFREGLADSAITSKIFEAVSDAYEPEIEFTVKKRKNAKG